jgi:predicted CoA-binding protein
MRTTRASVDAFVAQPSFALVGASRGGRKFGNTILRELRGKGMRIYPVHPMAATIDGVPCYRRLADLPERVGGVIVSVPAAQAVDVIREAAAAGIRHVWLQQGAESPYVEALCSELGLDAVAGECILMFAAPTGIHRFHRFVSGAIGHLPR